MTKPFERPILDRPVIDRPPIERGPILRWPVFRCFKMPIKHTAVYVVRHCEVLGGSNPNLSTAGQQRAALLARKLTAEPLDAVYVTQYNRTQQTGQAVAAAAGLTATSYDATDAQVPVDDIMNNHVGGRALIVGHSNTVDDICSALGVNGVGELDHDHFDRLFVVHRFATTGHLERLRYGAAT